MNTRATIFLLSLSAFGYGCESKSSATEPKETSEKPATTQAGKSVSPFPDLRKDGKAYSERRALNARSWGRTAPLPSCEDRQLDASDVALCKRAVEARAALRKAEEEGASEKELLQAAFDYADVAQAVATRFQGYAMIYVMGKDPREVVTVEVASPKAEAARKAKKTAAGDKDKPQGKKADGHDHGHDHGPGAHAIN